MSATVPLLRENDKRAMNSLRSTRGRLPHSDRFHSLLLLSPLSTLHLTHTKPGREPMNRHAKRFALGLSLLLLNGCALKYYDANTGTEHLWGFGHFRMKAPPRNADRAFVTGSQMLGLNLRAGRDDYGIGVGYDSHSRVTMPPNGTLCLEWPTNVSPLPRAMRDLFTARIGTNFPPQLNRMDSSEPKQAMP